MSNQVLHIDIETYCELDLAKTGVYAYAKHPSFEILLFAYAFDHEPVQCIDMTEKPIPLSVLKALYDPSIKKVAHNANFEMTCLAEHFKHPINPEQWECTMALAMQNGLPGSLSGLSDALNLQKQKMSVGTALISYFSKPCKPTKANGFRTRNLPKHDPEKWEVFKDYNIRDVEAEQEIYDILLAGLSQPAWERKVYLLDKEINDRGIMIDRKMVEHAVGIDDKIAVAHEKELRKITGLSNPNSTDQFKQYLARVGIQAPSLTKKIAVQLFKDVNDPVIKRAIELKLLLSKTSTAKYKAMLNAVCEDDRVRGLFQYYGANRTGRWAGRLVQLQNLPQNHIEELDLARSLVAENNIDAIELIYTNVPDVLSQLIRTAMIAKPGHKFVVADYSAIEARVIAWLAGEDWRMDVFEKGGDIYCASASQMFKVPVEKHGVNGHLRQKGKIAELALGYGGGPGALISMGAIEMGLTEEELPELVKAWRGSNTNITKFWQDCQDAAMEAIDLCTTVKIQKGIVFLYRGGNMYIQLPSGRKLCYQDTRLVKGRYGYRITYKGQNQQTRKWETADTYGGKLVENIVQATARDVLAQALLRIRDKGFEIVAHVHDEVIVEAPTETTVQEICDLMDEQLPWMKGLLVRADGYETPYYKKD